MDFCKDEQKPEQKPEQKALMLSPIPTRPSGEKEKRCKAERGHCFSPLQAGLETSAGGWRHSDSLWSPKNLVLPYLLTYSVTGSGVAVMASVVASEGWSSALLWSQLGIALAFIDSHMSIMPGLFRQE